MAKLQRKSAKLFAESANAGIGGVAQFGSLAAGDINYSKDPDVIQALDAFKKGWSEAVTGNKSPAIEDRNALDYLLSYQQAYIMQRGIPEWLSTETYYAGSVVSLSSGRVYVSKTDNNIGNNPSLDTTEANWLKFPTPQELADGLALKVSKSGDTMTGDLVMDGVTVYNKVSGTNYRVLDTRDISKTGGALGVPDMTAGVDITSGSQLPVNALVVIQGNPGLYGNTQLFIDGVKVYSGGVSEDSQRDRSGNCIAKSGSVVTTSGNVSSLKYYPLGA